MLVLELAAIIAAGLIGFGILAACDREEEHRSQIEWEPITIDPVPFFESCQPEVTDEAIHAWLAGPYDQEKDAA